MKTVMIPMIFTVLLIAAVSFFAGMKYQASKAPSNAFRQFQNGNRMGGAARLNGGRPVVGEILSQDDKSITVKMQDGSSKIVILSQTTTYNKTAEGSKDDLKVGARVGVFGTDNTDGSVTAQNIQLNPTFRASASGTPR